MVCACFGFRQFDSPTFQGSNEGAETLSAALAMAGAGGAHDDPPLRPAAHAGPTDGLMDARGRPVHHARTHDA